MLIVGDATLCMVDGVDAAAHGITEGNIVSFVCHLNLVGWIRLIVLVLKELQTRYGTVVEEVINKFINSILEDLQTSAEKKSIQNFSYRLEVYDERLAYLFAEFVAQVEEEYAQLYAEIDATFDESRLRNERAMHSVSLARVSGVPENKIVNSRKELDELFK